MSSIQCPACKEPQEINVSNCTNCRFPFTGSTQEKSKHIAQFINKKSVINDAEEALSRSKKILFLISGYNFLFILVSILSSTIEVDVFSISINLILGLGFVICGLLLKKSPMFFSVFPLGMILGLYTVNFILYPDLAMRGIIYKLIIVGSLIYSIYLLQKAKTFNKQFSA